jgi:hypothetical protein
MQAIPSGVKEQQKEPGPRTRRSKDLPKITGCSDGENERVKLKVRRTVKISCLQLYHIFTTDAP